MQQTRNAVDVLVVGAGPTGLVMAAELARRGVACRVIDKLPAATQTSKALAVQSRTLELFDVIASETMPEGVSTNVPVLLDGKGSMHAHYGAATDCLYLVRPDGYIGYRSMPTDAAHFWEYTQMLFV